jgi:hypothetical protein
MSPDSRPFKNSNLFSNHYLEKQVMDSAKWREAKPGPAFSAIKELYERKARVLENYNESQLEENFIRPVLRILGHHFEVQGKVAGKDRTPDYAFFPDKGSLEEAEAYPARTTTGAPWLWAMPSPGRSRWTRAARDRAASRCKIPAFKLTSTCGTPPPSGRS